MATEFERMLERTMKYGMTKLNETDDSNNKEMTIDFNFDDHEELFGSLKKAAEMFGASVKPDPKDVNEVGDFSFILKKGDKEYNVNFSEMEDSDDWNKQIQGAVKFLGGYTEYDAESGYKDPEDDLKWIVSKTKIPKFVYPKEKMVKKAPDVHSFLNQEGLKVGKKRYRSDDDPKGYGAEWTLTQEQYDTIVDAAIKKFNMSKRAVEDIFSGEGKTSHGPWIIV